MATYTHKDFLSLTSLLLGPRINFYFVTGSELDISVLLQRTKGSNGVLVLGSKRNGYYLIYFDLKKYIIHTHNTDGRRMNHDFYNMLANLRVNRRRFQVHQHHIKAPHGYAGAFILYAAQAYSKGKNEINRNVDFESIAQHYDSLVNKNRARQYQPEKNSKERLAGKSFSRREPKKDSNDRISRLAADSFYKSRGYEPKGIKGAIVKGLVTGVARNASKYALRKFDEWRKKKYDDGDEPWYSSSNISKSVKGVYGKLKEYGKKFFKHYDPDDDDNEPRYSSSKYKPKKKHNNRLAKDYFLKNYGNRRTW